MYCISVNNRSLYRFASPYIKENMYVLIKGEKALVIDPNGSEEALNFIKANGVCEVTIFLTHEHQDHTCGIPILEKNFQKLLICQEQCANKILNKRNNRPLMTAFVLAVQDEKNGTNYEAEFIKNVKEYSCHADVIFKTDFVYNWCGEEFVFYHTPGHSQGSCCITWNNVAVFTGDSLLKDMPVITRFPGGNTKQYNQITKPYLDALSDNILVLPGHGDDFVMKELREKVL